MAEKSCVSPVGTPPAAPGGMKGPQFSSAWFDVQGWVSTVETPRLVLLHPHPPSLHDSLWLNGSAHISRLLPCKPRNLFFFFLGNENESSPSRAFVINYLWAHAFHVSGVCQQCLLAIDSSHPMLGGDLIMAQLSLTGLSDDLWKNCKALSIFCKIDR